MLEEKIYEGCAVSVLCEGECRKRYKDTCPSFYKFIKVPKVNKVGKVTNRYSIIEVK